MVMTIRAFWRNYGGVNSHFFSESKTLFSFVGDCFPLSVYHENWPILDLTDGVVATPERFFYVYSEEQNPIRFSASELVRVF